MKRLSSPAADYVRSINEHDAAAFRALFADGAVVEDNGRAFHGRAEIEAWGDQEIFAPSVTLDVLEVAEREGATIVTTKVDGNFDRTGLPNPVVIDHEVRAVGGKIVGLSCRLAERQRT